MNKLRRFFRLSQHERSLLLIALGGLPLVTAGVYVFGYKRMGTLLAGPETRSMRASVSRRDEAVRIAAAVRRAARYGLLRGTCLSRSLLLLSMLKRRGIAAEIRFGVRPGNTAMEAHAWVEQDGHSLDDGFEEHAFADLEPARPQDPTAS
jgi:hypothetical protein